MSKARNMKEEEVWAEEYLKFRGFTDVVFEPDGNVTPDFLVDGKIAVEVRRLNQHHENESGENEPLEKVANPLRDRLERLLGSFGPPSDGVSWFVTHKFQRPQLTKKWERVLREKLRLFQDSAVAGPKHDITVDPNFKLELKRRREPGGRAFFMLTGQSDFDGGGWAIPELEKNIQLCIDEKTDKIAPHRAKYPEWWLLLVDYMFGGSERRVNVTHEWDKVLVIHPANYAGAYEIKSVRSR